MNDLIRYDEQFGKIVDIVESAGERAYRKVNEELFLMIREIPCLDGMLKGKIFQNGPDAD